jgi:hypothetical protein
VRERCDERGKLVFGTMSDKNNLPLSPDGAAVKRVSIYILVECQNMPIFVFILRPGQDVVQDAAPALG